VTTSCGSEWAGVVQYDKPLSPFCPLFGQFSVGWGSSAAMGLGDLAAKGVLSTYDICSPTLAVGFQSDGLLSARRTSLTSLPWLCEEEGIYQQGLERLLVKTRSAFMDEQTLELEVTILNQGRSPSESVPVLFGCSRADDRTYMLDLFPGASLSPRKVSVSATGSSISIIWDPLTSRSSLPGAAVRIDGNEGWVGESCGDSPFAESSETGPWYRLTPSQWEPLSPGEARTASFVIRAAFCQPGSPVPSFNRPSPRGVDSCAENQRLDWTERLGEFNGTASRAKLALLRTGVRGLGGEFGDHVASLCTSSADDFSSSFFWDSLFSSAAIARFDPEFAQGAVITAFTRHDPRDGSTPERKWNYCAPQRMPQQDPQSPIASWAVTQILRQGDDEAFLKQIYPLLKANHGFWENYSDSDRDGLSEYRWSGQAGDNSPLWDGLMGDGEGHTGCAWIPPVASVALNCFLYWDARHLEALALHLGRQEEAEGWAARKIRLAEALTRVCYCPDDKVFWDYDHRIQRHKKSSTFFMFWPLIVDLPMPSEARETLLRRLLDRTKFFGGVPFPSVPLDDPLHEPSGYWRGKSWPHITYWLIQTLWRLGLEQEADEAAHRSLFAFSASPGFLENQKSLLASGGKQGFPDYNWGCASALLLAERAYRDRWQPEDGLGG
jgi:hypothetical protein